MKKLLLTFIMMTLSLGAIAFPKAPFNALETSVSGIKFLEDDDANFDYDFEGIVKLSNCSGSVIKFTGQPKTSQAYVLTNGHCLGGGLMKPGAVYTNRKVQRRMKVSDSDMNFTDVMAETLVYATMTETDAAIYQLKETYQELESRGVRAFAIDNTAPLIGLPIDIVSGYWERGYRCHIAANIFQLREYGYVFTNSVRYSEEGCKIIGGTSGSPVIEQNTRTVIAINNTGNESGQLCTLNNPCEVDEDGQVTVIKDAGYAQQTYMFTTCLTPDFKIDLEISSCLLPKPSK